MKRTFHTVLLFFVVSALFSCASNPYSKTNKVYKKEAKKYVKQLKDLPANTIEEGYPLIYGDYPVGTTNFNLRKPDYVVIHHTAQDSVGQTLRTFILPRTQVSAHYVIAKNGKVYHMLNDYLRAWHGGAGQWGSNTDLNSSSIGIELDNNGFEAFPEAQIYSLMALLNVLKENYKIPTANFIGHSDIAPSRKVDPNAFFPWEKLAEEGFGLWYDEDLVYQREMGRNFSEESENPLIEQILMIAGIYNPAVVPEGFNPLEALKIIGYDISDSDAAIKAFELHFIQNNIDGTLDDHDLAVLYELYKKYL